MKAKQWLASALLIATSGIAQAQDGGNLVAALDHGVANLDSTVRALLQGDVTGTVGNLNGTVGTLLIDLTDGTQATRLAEAGVRLSDALTGGLTTVTPLLDQLAAPVAEIAAPVSDVYLRSGVLANGLPLVDGESVVLLADTGLVGELAGRGLPIDLLRALLKADLIGPGDDDGGGALVLGLADGQGGVAIPQLGGGMLAGGMVLGPGEGMARDELPIEAASLDTATLAALTSGARLQGL